jgi:hypothetical protein
VAGDDFEMLEATICGIRRARQKSGGRHGGWCSASTGITFMGRPDDDARGLHLAHGYEQATRHRRPPPRAADRS